MRNTVQNELNEVNVIAFDGFISAAQNSWMKHELADK